MTPVAWGCDRAETAGRVGGVTITAKLSELTVADEIHERDMTDPAYRAEYDRTRFANDIAIRVLRYRTDHHLTQTASGRLVSMRQPHVARLKPGSTSLPYPPWRDSPMRSGRTSLSISRPTEPACVRARSW